MFRLLIVDDEIESLEWLEEMFEKVKEEEISIYTASSGKKAIEILNRVKCDVVLTDIKMPGMDGMELYRHVKENWPSTKVVFLTGYSTHEILYQAVQNKEIRYLMKTESPQKIVETVLEAYREVCAWRENILRQEKRDALLEKAQYWLQKELIEQMVFGAEEAAPFQEQMDFLDFPIRREQPVIIFLGKTDVGKGGLTSGKKEDILFIIEQNMPGIMRTSVFTMESAYLLGIVQPKLEGERVDWKRAFGVCFGALEDVQNLCGEKLGIKVSFAVLQDKARMEDLREIYYLLKRRLVTIIRKEEPEIIKAGMEDLDDKRIDNKLGLIKLPMLDSYLEQGNYRECKAVLREITGVLLESSSMHDMKALELYYNIAIIYLKYINSNGWEEKVPFYIGLYPLVRVDDFSDWNEAADYLTELTEVLFRMMDENDDARKNQAVLRVEQHIHENLKGDLGLQVLADVGGFNASYLSRIFKQKYHCNLSEYITRERINLARELLVNTNEKIYRIGEEAGYRTAGSFNRAFVKSEGMTPAEYRLRFSSKR